MIGIACSSGLLAEYIIATYLPYTGTTVMNTAMAALTFVAFYFSVETPYFSVTKERRKGAQQNLSWLYGEDASQSKVDDEMRRIEKSIAEEKPKTQSLKLLLSAANLKVIILVVSVIMLTTATGINVARTYGSLIFSPWNSLTANEFMIMFGVATLMAVSVSPFFIEKVDRRSVIIVCCLGITVCHICSYLLMYLHNRGYEFTIYPWLIFCSVAVYGMFYQAMLPALFAINGELLPFSVRAIGCSLAITGFSVASFCNTKMFSPISENFGKELNFLIYAGV